MREKEGYCSLQVENCCINTYEQIKGGGIIKRVSRASVQTLESRFRSVCGKASNCSLFVPNENDYIVYSAVLFFKNPLGF